MSATFGTMLVESIVQSKDYALAEAARPVMRQTDVWFTVIIAIIATTSGLLASMFACIAHACQAHTNETDSTSTFRNTRHRTESHSGVHHNSCRVICSVFDLSRIASLGAIFYLLMDIVIHWGVLRYLVLEVNAHKGILATAIVLDVVVLPAALLNPVSSSY